MTSPKIRKRHTKETENSEHGTMSNTSSIITGTPSVNGVDKNTVNNNSIAAPATDATKNSTANKNVDVDTIKKQQQAKKASENKNESKWRIALFVLTIIATAIRVWRIDLPHEVVFDEVHFGKFASYYLQRTYFFDVHPPLGKLILAAAGYFVGYDGHFHFDTIGDDYYEFKVPHVPLRLVPAFFGISLIPIFFLTMKEMGVSLVGVIFGTCLLVFDNALIVQSRFILMDTMLLCFGLMSIYCWVRFYKKRNAPFTSGWWFWLAMTGVSLGLTTSVKLVGLFTVATIGIAVLFDLWRLLDIRRGLTIRQLTRHFSARALMLIFLPISIYLSTFYIHFKILYKSGPGDAFMTPKFQMELNGSDVSKSWVPLYYNANVTLKNRKLEAWLHSHMEKYPLVYSDGRVSTRGQQVTGSPELNRNCYWVIEPVDPSRYPRALSYELSEDEKTKEARHVRNQDIVRLRNINTRGYLRTHDVASSLMPTHMEMTTTNEKKLYEHTLWRVEVAKEDPGDPIKSRRDHIKLISVLHNSALHTHPGKLPEWGSFHYEVNGNKNLGEDRNIWVFDVVEHPRIVDGKEIDDDKKKLPEKQLTFLDKFAELQEAIFRYNSGLLKEHPYSSKPIEWALLLTGVAYWERKKGFRQIFFLGNPFICWLSILCVFIYAAFWIVDRLIMRRGIDELGLHARRWFDRSIGFVFLAWVLHYLPFFFMQRVLFYHHYLPSFIFSAMVTTLTIDFMARVTSEEAVRNRDTIIIQPNTPISQWMKSNGSTTYVIIAAIIIILSVCFFYFFSPLTYGLTLEAASEVTKRRWLPGWDMQHG